MCSFLSWEQRVWILWDVAGRWVECLIHWMIWKDMIIVSIMNRLRIIINRCSITGSKHLKCVWYCESENLHILLQSFYEFVKKLSCFSMRSSISHGNKGLIHAKIFLPLSTRIFLVNFLLRLFGIISFICSLDGLP